MRPENKKEQRKLSNIAVYQNNRGALENTYVRDVSKKNKSTTEDFEVHQKITGKFKDEISKG